MIGTTPGSAFVADVNHSLEAAPTKHPITQILEENLEKCTGILAAERNESGYCPTFWDQALCWEKTKAGTLASLPCPAFLNLNSQENATRLCTTNGTWFWNTTTKEYWGNYTACIKPASFNHTIIFNHTISAHHTEWLPVIKKISQVGYAVSFFTLILALIILVSIKKLRCPRNTLHMHLFVSFMLRAFMAWFKDLAFIDGVGPSKSIVDGQFSHGQPNWECKVVTSLWQYFIVANYTWILMEGLYLHNLIFLAPFSDSSAITLYVILGWGCPLLVVGTWVTARTIYDDTLCWTTQTNYENLFLIIRIPIIVSIVLNFMFFMNIVRVLLLKLQSAVSFETRKYRYSKWAKSTLVLVPLFGVHYMLFIGMSYYMGVDPVIEVIWLFCDQLFASFQGFFVSILYCLLNGEVRSELGKKWSNWRSENDAKNIWVPLNQISSKFYHRSTHEEILTNGLSLTPGNTVNGNGNGHGSLNSTNFSSCRSALNNKAKYATNGSASVLGVSCGSRSLGGSNQELTETHNLTHEISGGLDEVLLSSPSPASSHKLMTASNTTITYAS